MIMIMEHNIVTRGIGNPYSASKARAGVMPRAPANSLDSSHLSGPLS